MTEAALFPVVITDKVIEAPGVISIHLESLDGTPLPAWTPGAHIDVRLPSGLVRQYSLNGDFRDFTSYRIGVLEDPHTRGGSREIHQELPVGSQLRIRPPRNRFELELADGYLFIVGGIGITPILPMIAQAEELGRPWRLVYGARTRDGLAYVAELAGHEHGEVMLVPQDEMGLLDLDAILARAGSWAVYACGPGPMLAVLEEKAASVLTPGQLRLERFSAPPDGEPDQRPNQPFELTLAQAGVTVTVDAQTTTLEAILAYLPEYLYGCQEGYCGTCIATVTSGVPEHRDSCLSEQEHNSNTLMTPCVSRARSLRLVLDI